MVYNKTKIPLTEKERMLMFGVIFDYVTWALLAVPVLLLLIRALVRKILAAAPRGGISKSMYVDINGTKQWISIYGKKKDNPVLLYLHGGPGASTSTYDYVFTRKWADIYTVVTWDQRNCGKSWSPEQFDTALTRDMMMEDGLDMLLYLRQTLGVEKVTLLGHSWGSYFGANLALEYPQFVQAHIGVGQLSGPIGIGSIVNESYNESKAYGAKVVLMTMLSLAILLSANLGVMNLLPIPALDGGRLLFLLIEAVRRKRIPPEKEGFVHLVGMGLLLLLMAFVMYNDISKLLGS